MTNEHNFSKNQSRFLILLAIGAVAIGLFLTVKNYSHRSVLAEPLPLIIAEPQQLFTGIFVVDPNSSPADSLELLPGIGPTLADRIVAYRQEHRFESEIDIINVKGIGPQLFKKIKPYLKVQSR